MTLYTIVMTATMTMLLVTQNDVAKPEATSRCHQPCKRIEHIKHTIRKITKSPQKDHPKKTSHLPATIFHGVKAVSFRGAGGVFLLEVQYSILKSLISTCVLSYVGSREDWLLDRICESKKDCWDSIRRTSYPDQ